MPSTHSAFRRLQSWCGGANLCCASLLFLAGCDQGPTKPDAIENDDVEAHMPTSLGDDSAEQSPTSETVVKQTTKSLDLTMPELEDETTEPLAEPDPVLPDLFAPEAQGERRVSTSGRLITNEEGGLKLDTVEGVEMRVEMKTK